MIWFRITRIQTLNDGKICLNFGTIPNIFYGLPWDQSRKNVSGHFGPPFQKHENYLGICGQCSS